VAYHITDRHCSLPSEAAWWDEALVVLPETHYLYPSRQPIANAPSRAAEGLPDAALVLCAFNNGYKIEPRVFGVWCELLRRLPQAVLWVYQSHPQQADNLRRALGGAGMAPERLVVSRYEREPALHLARLGLADLFVDTFDVSAHTTMLDALYAGVPPVSVAGSTTVGRLGASLVRAAGLPDNVCTDPDLYLQRVLQLALDPVECRRQRRHLLDLRAAQRGPFDMVRRVRDLEAAYTEMWRRHAAGLALAGFEVGEKLNA